MDAIQNRLEEIDLNVGDPMNFGNGSMQTVDNNQDELLSGNFNSPYFGGSKYGIIRADIGGFEGSPVLRYNNDSASFNFRRTVGRDMTMSRHFMEFPCADEMRQEFAGCPQWNDLWDDSAENMYKQIINEAVWMSLAWGFHPSIHGLIPDYDGLEDLIEDYIRPRFLGDANFEGYTTIYKRLHLAGWKPVTNAEAHVDEGAGELPLLYVERFGPDTVSGPNDAKFFTVLNNDTLAFTLAQLTEEDVQGGQGNWPPAIFFDDIEDLQSLNHTDKCEDVQYCSNYPDKAVADDYFDDFKDKNFYLEISDPLRLGLWNGNLYGEQLVDNPENPGIVNWPWIIADEFDESQGQTNYSIRRNTAVPVSIIIGGQNPTDQERILIEDKALMVFKIWSSLIVNNGPEGGGDGERGSQTDSALVSQYYERYGSNWQRLESDLGYGGTLDQLPSSDSWASAFYKFTIGLGGSYRVMAHLPAATEAPALAQYEAYVLDYLEDPAGATDLEDPVWTTTLDLTGSETYNPGVDEDGFIEIGTVTLNLTEPELATVVIRLSSAGDGSEGTSAGSGYVLADAVKLVPEEGLE